MTTYILIGIAIVFVLLICFALAVASFSSENYLENLKITNSLPNSSGLSTLDYVSQINERHFSNKIAIEKCEQYQDHYSRNKIALSHETMYSNNLASLAIVSHELGHARQDFEGDKLTKHWKLRSFGKKCGFLFMPLLLIGVVLSLLSVFEILSQPYILYIGLACVALAFAIFIFAIVLKYKEIQVEKEASVYALDFLREFLSESEVLKCKNLLNSARLTYWASLFKTIFGWTFLTSKNKMFR